MITQLKNGRAAAPVDNSAQNVWKFMVHLVADAVQVEPVSQFPANREKNREFFQFWARSHAQRSSFVQ